MPNNRFPLILSAFALLATTTPAPARAIPVFAHRYGYSCQACHTTVPHLNAFGQSFRANGYRIAGLPTSKVFPIAAKFNLAYSSSSDPSGLPKYALDELELLTGGHLNDRVSYFVEQYVIDGARPGNTRDAWLQIQNAVAFKVGQFTLPLPVDPETERDTLAHYAAFDQTVGNNPFNFFDQRAGVDALIGSPLGGNVHVVAVSGHDPQSGLPRSGIDTMLYGQTPIAGTFASVYRYDGTRPSGGPIADRFWRQALGLTKRSERFEFDALVQNGLDRSVDGFGASAKSGAGFAQVRWAFSPSLAAISRYDFAGDDVSPAHHRVIASLIARPARNARFTIEGVFAPQSTTINSALLFAF